MKEPPSFQLQTKWKAGLIEIPGASSENRYFNPTIVERRDGSVWLIARHSIPFPLADIGMNDLEAFRLDQNYKPLARFKVQFPARFRDEHFEDPRAQIIGGRMTISCTNFQLVRGLPWRGSHQIFVIVDDTWKVVSRVDPVYGLNGASPYVQRGNEKNWLWFQHGNHYYMVYTIVPHQVALFTDTHGASRTYATKATPEVWKFGILRGGTPPVRFGDNYWSFFHSSMPWRGKKRRYYMGAYAFAAQPPFGITAITPKPLLVGSQHDPWTENLPLVIFPGGALLHNDTWRVVFGVNDCACGYIEIPHKDLERRMRSVRSHVVDEYVDVAGYPMTIHGLEPDLSKVTLVKV